MKGVLRELVCLEMRALVLRDLAEFIPENFYGMLREYDIESAVLDHMLGQQLRFSSSHSGISRRHRRASDLLIYFGYYRIMTRRADLAEDDIYTLRQLFGPRAATTDFLKEFEDVPSFGDFKQILALMERNFPDLVRAYAAGLPAAEKEEILAFMGERDQEAAEIEAAQAKEAVSGITKQQVIGAFEGLHFSTDAQWSKALADVPKWLEPCRVLKGKPGNKRDSALWNPVLIAIALLDKGIPIKKLDMVFVKLKDWADEWREILHFPRSRLKHPAPSYRTHTGQQSRVRTSPHIPQHDRKRVV